MNRTMKSVKFAEVVLVASVVVAWATSARSNLVLHAIIDESTLCVSEPIKIRVRFENVGTDAVRIFSVDQLGNNMRYMFLELEYPTGVIEWRSFQFAQIIEAINPMLSGEAILPGNETEVVLYPHMTQLIGPTIEPGAEKGTRFTFSTPGKYKVRVGYWVPDHYVILWKPPGGILYSESLNLTIREPEPAEREVLDAVWSGDRFYMLLGDDLSHLSGPDEARLRDVIARWPELPIIRHAMFALGRMLAYEKDPMRAQEGMALLSDLNRRFPTFRGPETRLHHANALQLRGETSLAEAEYDSALREYPQLVDSQVFMTRKLNAECSCADGFRAWERARAEGRKLRSAHQISE